VGVQERNFYVNAILETCCSHTLLLPIFSPQPHAAETKQMLKLTHGMTAQSLAGRSDLEIVELSSGRHVSVGLLRHLDSAMHAARAPSPIARQWASR